MKGLIIGPNYFNTLPTGSLTGPGRERDGRWAQLRPAVPALAPPQAAQGRPEGAGGQDQDGHAAPPATARVPPPPEHGSRVAATHGPGTRGSRAAAGVPEALVGLSLGNGGDGGVTPGGGEKGGERAEAAGGNELFQKRLGEEAGVLGGRDTWASGRVPLRRCT